MKIILNNASLIKLDVEPTTEGGEYINACGDDITYSIAKHRFRSWLTLNSLYINDGDIMFELDDFIIGTVESE